MKLTVNPRHAVVTDFATATFGPATMQIEPLGTGASVRVWSAGRHFLLFMAYCEEEELADVHTLVDAFNADPVGGWARMLRDAFVHAEDSIYAQQQRLNASAEFVREAAAAAGVALAAARQ